MSSETMAEVYETPILLRQLRGHLDTITCLHFNPVQKQIVTGSLDRGVLIWDANGIKRTHRYWGHKGAVLDVCFSPSGTYVASASQDTTVYLWLPSRDDRHMPFKAHTQPVTSVSFNSFETQIMTASDDGTVKLWSMDGFGLEASFVGHNQGVTCARMNKDQTVIASCSSDKKTKLWDPSNGECIHSYDHVIGHGTTLDWHFSGYYLAAGTTDGSVNIHDIRTHRLVHYYSHRDEVTCVAFHPCKSFIITSSKDSDVQILDLSDNSQPIFTSGHSGGINAVSWSPKGYLCAAGGNEKVLRIWKTKL